jgi:uncharacterized protein HemX
MPRMSEALETAEPENEPTDLTRVRSAARRFAAREAQGSDAGADAIGRAAPVVLGTVLGGLALAALGGLTGAISLGFAPVVVGILVAAGAVAGLVRLGEAEAQREATARRAARDAREEASGELLAAIEGALAHVERLDAERAGLHRKIDKLERRLAAKDRQLARLQAFDAERRTLGPAPADRPAEEQLTLEAVLALQEAGGDEPTAA